MPDAVPTNHDASSICRQCCGRCCQGHPGVWIDPERFLACFNLERPESPATLREAIEPHGLTLREIEGTHIPAPRQRASGCIFLAEQGCRLTERQRPCQCLALTPDLETLLDDQIHCFLPPEGSTATAIRRWRAFWEMA